MEKLTHWNKSLLPALLVVVGLVLTHFVTSCEVEPEPEPEFVQDTVSKVFVTDITPYSAVVSGHFSDDADSSDVVGLRYSLVNTRFITSTGTDAVAQQMPDGTYRVELDGLYADTTYYFKTYVLKGREYVNSETFAFRTHRLTARTDSATNIHAFGATLGYTLSEEIEPEKFKGSFGVYYSTRPRVIREQSKLCDPSLVVNGLIPGETYYYRAFVLQKTERGMDHYIWGDAIELNIPEIGVKTFSPERITPYSALLIGEINVKSDAISEIGFLLSERNRVVTIDSVESTTSDQDIRKVPLAYYEKSDVGRFYTNFGNLISNKYYYCRAYARISELKGGVKTNKVYYGDMVAFRTTKVSYTDGESVDLGLSVEWSSRNYMAESPVEVGELLTYEQAKETIKGDWRLPTYEEAKELVDSCRWLWTTYKGVSGVAVYGPTGNSIFLPASHGVNPDIMTFGIYAQDAQLDSKSKEPLVTTIRFVQDPANDTQAGKSADNLAGIDVPFAIRAVRDK